MKRAALTLAATFLLIAGAARADLEGGWTASRAKSQPGWIHLQLNRDHDNTGQSMKLAELTGLTAAQIDAAGSTPVAFSLRREAGTVTFEGSFRNGHGGGEFTFAPNAAYLASLRELGVPVKVGKHEGESEEEQLLSLAVLDVSTAFIRSMQAVGYRESLDDYIEMRIFKVDPELVSEYQALGMKLSADDLVAGQIHGVSPDYVREMRELDRKVTFDDLVASRIHGATPEFIGQMRDLGYGGLDLDDYVTFRIHGVTPKFVGELAELGYRDVKADDLVAFKIHGVTPEFIRDLQARGEHDLSPDDLISMKIHGRWR